MSLMAIYQSDDLDKQVIEDYEFMRSIWISIIGVRYLSIWKSRRWMLHFIMQVLLNTSSRLIGFVSKWCRRASSHVPPKLLSFRP